MHQEYITPIENGEQLYDKVEFYESLIKGFVDNYNNEPVIQIAGIDNAMQDFESCMIEYYTENPRECKEYLYMLWNYMRSKIEDMYEIELEEVAPSSIIDGLADAHDKFYNSTPILCILNYFEFFILKRTEYVVLFYKNYILNHRPAIIDALGQRNSPHRFASDLAFFNLVSSKIGDVLGAVPLDISLDVFADTLAMNKRETYFIRKIRSTDEFISQYCDGLSLDQPLLWSIYKSLESGPFNFVAAKLVDDDLPKIQPVINELEAYFKTQKLDYANFKPDFHITIKYTDEPCMISGYAPNRTYQATMLPTVQTLGDEGYYAAIAVLFESKQLQKRYDELAALKSNFNKYLIHMSFVYDRTKLSNAQVSDCTDIINKYLARNPPILLTLEEMEWS